MFIELSPVGKGLIETHRLKIGDDAIVDLTHFTLEGSSARSFRGKVTKLEKQGIRTPLHEPPLPQQVLKEARTVSDEWLQIPGRNEHGFSVGWFEDSYVRNTPLFAVEDATGRMLAFANIIPSGRKGEATVDMMRHRKDVPNGIMALSAGEALSPGRKPLLGAIPSVKR